MEITGILLYLMIVGAKAIEVSLSTVRMVLITKGEKKVGAIIAFFELILWIIIVNGVLDGVAEDPFKAVAYALGYSIGSYVGSTIEGKLAFGNTSMMCVIDGEDKCGLIDQLRENGIAVTVLDANGRDSEKKVLMIFVKRKRIGEVSEIIKKCEPNALITTSEIKPVSKIYGILK